MPEVHNVHVVIEREPFRVARLRGHRRGRDVLHERPQLASIKEVHASRRARETSERLVAQGRRREARGVIGQETKGREGIAAQGAGHSHEERVVFWECVLNRGKDRLLFPAPGDKALVAAEDLRKVCHFLGGGIVVPVPAPRTRALPIGVERQQLLALVRGGARASGSGSEPGPESLLGPSDS